MFQFLIPMATPFLMEVQIEISSTTKKRYPKDQPFQKLDNFNILLLVAHKNIINKAKKSFHI
jgi:hypothetical protein